MASTVLTYRSRELASNSCLEQVRGNPTASYSADMSHQSPCRLAGGASVYERRIRHRNRSAILGSIAAFMPNDYGVDEDDYGVAAGDVTAAEPGAHGVHGKHPAS